MRPRFYLHNLYTATKRWKNSLGFGAHSQSTNEYLSHSLRWCAPTSPLWWCDGGWIPRYRIRTFVWVCVCVFSQLSRSRLTGSISLRYQWAYKYVECLQFGWSIPVVDVFSVIVVTVLYEYGATRDGGGGHREQRIIVMLVFGAQDSA